MTEETVRTCIFAGFDVRGLEPIEVYDLAGRITGDRLLQERAYSYTTPFPKSITDGLHGVNLSTVLADKRVPQEFKDFCCAKLEESVVTFSCYARALSAMSKGELAALRARVKTS